MPLYTYTCDVCGYKFDDIKPVRLREVPSECPQCGADASRTWSAPATPIMDPANPVKPRRGGGGYA